MEMDAVSKLIPRLIQNGVFGSVKFISISSDLHSTLAPQFSSTINFVKIRVAIKEGEEEIPVVIKLQLTDPAVRIAKKSHLLFSNEVKVYNDIFPYIGADKINVHPKAYYGYASDGEAPEKDIIIIENLNYQGFTTHKNEWMLDFEVVSLSIKKLAEFHALSYIKKHENPEQFYDLVKKLTFIVIEDLEDNYYNVIKHAALERGAKRVMESRGEDKEVLQQFLNVTKNVNEIRRFLTTPLEPFSVLCHGDLLTNNISYKYDEKNCVVDCRFYDFQNSLYTSPAIDLSFFLYMHTTQDFRLEFWHEILQLYWTTVRKYVPKHIKLPSFEEFKQHFATRAVYGYIPSAYFLPMMISNKPAIPLEDLMKLTMEEKMNSFITEGGELGTELVTDIVTHLVQQKYIHRFLDSFSSS